MWQICDIIKTFEHFPSIRCFKKQVIKQHPEQELRDYLHAINYLPLSWEDLVTQSDDIWEDVLKHMRLGLQYIDKPAVMCDTPIAGQCHKNTLNLIKQNPTWVAYTGFAAMETCCVGNEWHLHSFCINNEGVIVEPTPLLRGTYYGTPITTELITMMADTCVLRG